jgi:hypothetical protein
MKAITYLIEAVPQCFSDTESDVIKQLQYT